MYLWVKKKQIIALESYALRKGENDFYIKAHIMSDFHNQAKNQYYENET